MCLLCWLPICVCDNNSSLYYILLFTTWGRRLWRSFNVHRCYCARFCVSICFDSACGLCCIIVHFTCRGVGVGCGCTKGFCVWRSVCVVCVDDVQSSPVIAGSRDTDGAQWYHIPEALFREGEFEKIIDRHREYPPPLNTCTPPVHLHSVSLCKALFLCCTFTNACASFPFFFTLTSYFYCLSLSPSLLVSLTALICSPSVSP